MSYLKIRAKIMNATAAVSSALILASLSLGPAINAASIAA